MTGSREGLVYLLHFIDPTTGEPARYRHAKHYTGWTSDLDARLAEHAAGRGARLLEVVKAAGIGWTLARTWPGARARERQLKNQGGASRHCPECGVRPRGGQFRERETRAAAGPACEPESLPPPVRPERPPAYERGADQARRSVRQQIAAGFAAARIAEVQARILGAVIMERLSAEGREANRGYRETAAALITAHHEISEAQPGAAPSSTTTHQQEGTEVSTGTAPGQDWERTEAADWSGAITAQQVIIAQANAGMTADQIEAHHQDVAASLLNGAETPDDEAFALEYGFAAEALVGDLRAGGPDRTPGAPHPDPVLAERGWRACEHGHGVYVRRQAQAEGDADREAA